MGMYTELHFNSALRKDVPVGVLEILGYMLGMSENEPTELPENRLFYTERWRYMLNMDSYYFDADTHSTLRHDWQGTWYLNIRCNLKNYDSEIEAFIKWISPYLSEYKMKGDFLGFYRYEENEEPTLIYFRGHDDE